MDFSGKFNWISLEFSSPLHRSFSACLGHAKKYVTDHCKQGLRNCKTFSYSYRVEFNLEVAVKLKIMIILIAVKSKNNNEELD